MLKLPNFGDFSKSVPKKKGICLMNAVMEFIVSSVLPLIGGLCLFLFGMNTMGSALERRAGSSLKALLGKLTNNTFLGFLTGTGVTAVIQSSSATTVMVVGFVNSGLMTLRQSIGVIMGANVGTTITAWILSLQNVGALGSDTWYLDMLKPTSFCAVLALVGIVMYMMPKSTQKRKDTATIMLAFAVLMFGMDIMSDAMKPLTREPAFQNLFIAFGNNPFLGVLVGAALTGIIQSSSASVGILQGFVTAAILSGEAEAMAPLTFGALLPIIMGQNIGTCITAAISAIGTSTNAKRASMIHLLFNVIGTGVLLIGYFVIDGIWDPVLFSSFVGPWGIPLAHTTMKLICVLLLMPMSRLLEKLACFIIREPKKTEDTKEEAVAVLDDRLLQAPAVALERARILTATMAEDAVKGLKESLASLNELTPERAAAIREYEDKGDHYEDILGTYLVKLSGCQLTEDQSAEVASLLHLIGDFERISDHAVNILESAEEIKEKKLILSDQAKSELTVLTTAVNEILTLSQKAFIDNDFKAAMQVEPLEQVIDDLKEKMRASHIFRLQKNECTIEGGFVWNDLLTNLERISDHCSNVAGCVIDAASRNLNLHESLRNTRENDAEYEVMHKQFAEKYSIVKL